MLMELLAVVQHYRRWAARTVRRLLRVIAV
jgi:hypothetical protein